MPGLLKNEPILVLRKSACTISMGGRSSTVLRWSARGGWLEGMSGSGGEVAGFRLGPGSWNAAAVAATFEGRLCRLPRAASTAAASKAFLTG